MTKLRIGIIGSGFMGMTHAAAAKAVDDIELAAIAGGRRASELAQKYGMALEPDGTALIERNDVDAVVITTPHHLHAADTLHAFRCGKHVLVEKPMATTTEDCVAMIEAAERAGRALTVGFQQRFRRNNREARRLVAEGELGAVHLAQVNMLPSMLPMLDDPGFTGWNWWLDPRSVGHIINGGPHAIDTLRWMLNSEPRSVSALCRTTRPNAEVEDTTAALIDFENGTVCVLTSSYMAPPPSFPGEEFRFRLMGSKAVMDSDPYSEVRLSRDGALVTVCVQENIPHQDSNTLLGPVRLGAYVDQFRQFVAATRGLPNEAATGQDGKISLDACLAMLESSRRQAVIPLR